MYLSTKSTEIQNTKNLKLMRILWHHWQATCIQ